MSEVVGVALNLMYFECLSIVGLDRTTADG